VLNESKHFTTYIPNRNLQGMLLFHPAQKNHTVVLAKGLHLWPQPCWWQSWHIDRVLDSSSTTRQRAFAYSWTQLMVEENAHLIGFMWISQLYIWLSQLSLCWPMERNLVRSWQALRVLSTVLNDGYNLQEDQWAVYKDLSSLHVF